VSTLSGEAQILKAGGVFSAAVPNAHLYIDAYYGLNDFDASTFCRYKPAYNYNSKIDYLNYMAYMVGHHKYMFDEENLIIILNKIGFQSAALREFNPVLDLKSREYESIYIEARK